MEKQQHLRFQAVQLSDLDDIRSFIAKHAQTAGFDPADSYDLQLIVTEAVTNIIEHGYDGQPGPLTVKVAVVSGEFIISLLDQAPHFDPRQAAIPDLTLPLEVRPKGGLGVHMMRYFSDQIRYEALPKGGNLLTLVKHIQPGEISGETQ